MSDFIPNKNFQHFLYWIVERQNIWWRKYNGLEPPWTIDPILNEFKFTNVYRCLDKVSQYLLKNVVYNGKSYEPEDIFYRILLFKHFNKNETWDALMKEFGDITLEVSLEEIAKYLDEYTSGNKVCIYNNAYMVTGYFYQNEKFSYVKGLSKYRAYFSIYEKEIFETDRLYKILESSSFEQLYNILRNIGIYGDFMAQQYCIDLNYSTLFNFSENDFVVTGPGSIRGIKWIFKDGDTKNFDYIGSIKWIRDNFEKLMKEFCNISEMEWNPLPWEPIPTLTNIQNCLCETSKFAKGLGHSFKKGANERIKNTYEHTKTRLDYVFPPKWEAKLPDSIIIN